MASRSNNKVTWSVEATEALIDTYNETRIQASLENSKTSKENSKISKTTDNNIYHGLD